MDNVAWELTMDFSRLNEAVRPGAQTTMIAGRAGAVPQANPSWERITPERARSLLKRGGENRQIKDEWVRSLAAVMRSGKFAPNGEPIILDRDGCVMDGQHRLLACMDSGCDFWCIVVYGVDRSHMDTIDTGRGRTAGDVLSMAGISYANSVAAAIRWAMILETGALNDYAKLSPQLANEFFQKNPEILDSVTKAYEARRILAVGLGGGLHFRFRKLSEEEANRFFADLASGAGLERGDPVLTLREALQAARMETKKALKKGEVVARCIRAWNARRSGIKLTIIRGTIEMKEGKRIMPRIV